MPSRAALSPQLIDAIEAGACVLAPHQRSAHWLKLRYANHAVAQGKRAWATPAIHSFNAFVAQLWREHGDPCQRVLSAEQSRCLWERIVLDSKWSEQLLSPRAAAEASFRSWERLHSFAIRREELQAAAQAADFAEAQALLEWSDRFAAQCRERGWLPAQRLPHALLECSIPIERIVALGDRWLPAQRALLDYWSRGGARVQYLPAEQAAERTAVYSCADASAELRAAAEWARDRLIEGAASVAVVVPQLNENAARVRRAFAETFAQGARTLDARAERDDRAQQEASFTLATYHSLGEFPVTQAALDILRVASGQASLRHVSGVLRNPFIGGGEREADRRAMTDAELRKQKRERFDLPDVERISRRCPAFNALVQQAQAVRAAAPPRALPSAMAEQFMSLWRAFGWPGDRSLQSEEQQLAARLQEALGEFGALDGLLGPLTLQQSVREFEQWTRTLCFEPRGAPAPIVILDAQSIDGLQFDAAWIAGMEESRWPPAPSPDPFIPLALQVRAGLGAATARLAHDDARRRFEQLKRLAKHVVFSWPRQLDDIDVMPCPWLRELGDAQEYEIAQALYAARVFRERPPLETATEERAPGLSAERARGGSRIFELQSQCPFRAFAELRLGAQPLDEVTASVDARERGTLMHAALADIWNTLRDWSGLCAKSDDQLTTLVRTTLARHAAKLSDGASPARVRLLQIEQDVAAERIMTLLQLDKARTPFKVAGEVERQERATVGALAFELRLDRMDELTAGDHAGERVIVDYKTGNTVSAASWTSDRPEQPQLPLYAVTHPERLSAVAFVTLGAKGVGYQGVACDDRLLPGVKAFGAKKPPLDNWEGLLQHWRRVIERLAGEFVAGRAAVDPLPNACRHCHLRSLCRVAERQPVDVDEEGSA